ncbi:MAG: type II toxin-antitoxin system HicB family antitoxin [Bacillota bacterium]
MKNYVYPAVFSKDDDCIAVEFPNLPGCLTFGESFEDTVNMAKDAMAGWIVSQENMGNVIPAPSMITAKEGETIMLVEFDSVEYRRKHERKAVKKTLSIPQWLNNLAEREGVNFSNVLQVALKEKLHVS